MTAPAVTVLVMSPDELEALVHAAVVAALAATTSAASAPALVTKQAAAGALGISTGTLDRLVRAGRVPFVKVGDVRRFDLAAVRASLVAIEARTGSAEQPKRAAVTGVRLLSRPRP